MKPLLACGRAIMGGGFLYFMPNNLVSVGLIVGLDYLDPFLGPHHEFQRLKAHPLIREILQNGKMVSYGAKTIPKAGLYAIPPMYTDGCLLIGDAAGFQNVMKLKGLHLVMKSAMLAVETIVEALQKNDFTATTLRSYESRFRTSWAYEEMRQGRNFHQSWEHGLIPALFNAGLEFLTGGWGFKERKHFAAGHTRMCKIGEYYGGQKSDDKYTDLKFDRQLTVDKVTDVFNAYNLHDGNQPTHLLIAHYDICNTRCTVEYGNPCRNFYPANVYEMVQVGHDKPELHLNPSNCVYCKTCDIMDPYEIITWVPPEGGSGPNYRNL